MAAHAPKGRKNIRDIMWLDQLFFVTFAKKKKQKKKLSRSLSRVCSRYAAI